MAAITFSVILEPRKIKSDTVSTVSPSISHEVMGPDAMIFVFWMLSFMTNLDSILKSRNIALSTKVRLVKATVFPVVMYGCESWTVKKAERRRIDAFWTVVLEKTLESPLAFKEIQPVHPKGDQSWVFTGRTDVEAETPILWPPDSKSWLIWKDPDAGKDWGQEKGTTEDEMVGWHHQLDRHGFGWTPGFCDGQGGLVCCGSWDCKESDTTEQLNWLRCKLS